MTNGKVPLIFCDINVPILSDSDFSQGDTSIKSGDKLKIVKKSLDRILISINEGKIAEIKISDAALIGTRPLKNSFQKKSACDLCCLCKSDNSKICNCS
ncbi:MAG: hypothetical protein A2504_15100 [Bdellovibrionales bacterium RIFOXYD12_FULL_39_22]|nr:MAG: hypothetical protein A2385_02530 [Bdellovibrionales bacterium RIFOXYB1_FULL_39_21]OFZ43123.1 MAG: hypothetical protein A2485_11675 [Bdellovibrionales bacterium RIFOXYC12_FULL_39_17]OFZ47861.1 MAG: hypothetical protein A2404_16315 [Bdellovibrionales bacterium RIFOXYC1_FULL_39_130]OFZ75641.1 MAG: hypothetical protein A2560_12815 [Bdellovibrionales bacterium RIFOXYD1_FULL_39_84]OFZ76106.1 MAG: hypothetical protein A2451_13700 [Bdellovibrionales bacterium RIFOXYC2_FULL_39_8]OFZ94131.1 MAG: